MVNCINLIIEMSPRFILGRENVPCVAEVVNRSLKADCTDFTGFSPAIGSATGAVPTPLHKRGFPVIPKNTFSELVSTRKLAEQ